MLMLSANNNIMLRTLCMVFGFAWFTNQSAQYGDVVLAANHILLQLVAFTAFFLDGYAFVAESLVGSAFGARDRGRFDLAVRRTSELAAATAVALALAVWLGGPAAVALLADMPQVQQTAQSLLPLTALCVLLSVPAFQLDGVFIGATATAQMRNAAIASLAVYLAAWWLLAGSLGVAGLWWAFIAWVVARALTLLFYYPGVRPGADQSD